MWRQVPFEKSLDLTWRLISISNSTKLLPAGIPGLGGQGGSGGWGGPGGSSYSWSESHTVRNSDGTSSTYYTTHSNPGGFSGSSGISGANGTGGNTAVAGNDAVFQILVDGHGSYGGRYEMEIVGQVHVEDFSRTGVVEPACSCRMNYHYRNNGEMPTPSRQLIFVGIEPDGWVLQNGNDSSGHQGAVPLPLSISADSTPDLLPRPITFQIADVPGPSVGEPFSHKTMLRHRAVVTRINQVFTDFGDFGTRVDVRFPLEITPLTGATAVCPGEEAPIIVKVRNISNVPVGVAASSRAAEVQVRPIRDPSAELLEAATSAGSRTWLAEQGYQLISPHMEGMEEEFAGTNELLVRKQLLDVPPGKFVLVPLTLLMLDTGLSSLVESKDGNAAESSGSAIGQREWIEDPTMYSHATIQTVLSLSYPETSSKAVREIQTRPFQVQLAEPFDFVPSGGSSSSSRVLLVTNDRTTRTEVVAWRGFISSALNISKASVSSWNSSLNGGMSLKHTPLNAGGEQLTEPLGRMFSGDGNTIIFLNNPCNPSGISTGNADSCAMEALQHRELLDACRDMGARVLVVGSQEHADPAARLTPLDAYRCVRRLAHCAALKAFISFSVVQHITDRRLTFFSRLDMWNLVMRIVFWRKRCLFCGLRPT